MEILIYQISAAVFGLLVGSFLNVLIYRLPIKKNFVNDRSHCPSCNKLIYWYENIPVFSWLFLRGKCSGCQVKISPIYPLVELFIGIVSFLLFPKVVNIHSLTSYIFFFSIACAFTVHFVIDLKHKILPNGVTLYLALLFLIQSFFSKPFEFWFFGLLIGFGFPAGVTWLFYVLRKKEGLGMGDIKLWAALGLILGPFEILRNIFMSCTLGSLIGLPMIVLGVIDKKTRIPFGPFILVVAAFQIYFPKYYKMLLGLIF